MVDVLIWNTNRNRRAVVDVLIWNTEVNQECSGECFNLEHSDQTGGQWLMYLSGTK